MADKVMEALLDEKEIKKFPTAEAVQTKGGKVRSESVYNSARKNQAFLAMRGL